jgi:leucyl aminopeptidase
MKLQDVLLLGAAASTTFAVPHPQAAPERLPLPQIPFDVEAQLPPVTNEKFLIELAPGETKWITEDEKWQLRRVR